MLQGRMSDIVSSLSRVLLGLVGKGRVSGVLLRRSLRSSNSNRHRFVDG